MTDEAYLNPPAGIGCRLCYDLDEENCLECKTRSRNLCMAIMGGCGCIDTCLSIPVNTTEVQNGLDISG